MASWFSGFLFKNHIYNQNKIILDLCGGTGSWSKPYVEAGYTVINLTLPQYNICQVEFCPAPAGLILFPAKDPMENLHVKANDVYGILAAPPCTMFSLARQNAKTPRDFNEGMAVVKACMEIIWYCRANGNLKFWALENPRAYLRQFLGRPEFHFEAWQFGDPLKKPTDIWGYFNEPIKQPIIRPVYPRKGKGAWSYQFSTPGQKERSITPPGFAKAFFKANQ